MTDYRRSSTIPFLTILLLAFSAGLSAAPVDSRITSVTVYSDRAIVTRTATNDLTAGEHTLTFENLPTALADPSLQASGFGVPGATILDVIAQTIYSETTANERVWALEDQIKNLQKQRRVLDDRSKILEEQRAFVQRMLQASTNSPSAASGSTAARPTLDEWQKLFSYTEESLGKVSTEQQSIDGQREELQAKQTALEKQLNELRGARGRQSKTVTVRVSLTTPGRLDVALRYSIPNAGWSPAYTARLRSTDRAIDLSYFGVVHNGTGEDWNNIALILSTARPGLGGGAPELQPWIADIVRARSGNASTVISPDMVGESRLILSPVDAEAGRGSATAGLPTLGNNVTSLSIVKSGKISPPPAESEAGLMAADVDANITSATFKIPVSVSVAGNNVSQKVAIKDARLAATLQFQSTPRILEAAFLSASASNTTDYPLLAGPINTYLDDTFVAANSLKTVMPGEKFELALGADEGIAVKRRLVNRFAEETGLTNKTHRITYEFLITLTNNKTTTERIVFKEPTPQPRDERIVVKLLSPQEKEIGTSNSPKEIMREENGRIAWRVNLRPGEKREFTLKLSIEYPNDVAISGLN
jgi:uncharacterized protein (TIGR02231 family)